MVGRRVAAVMNGTGKPQKDLGDPDVPEAAVVMGSGFLNLNPTLVRCRWSDHGGEETTIVLSAFAKEGLIKQKSAHKALLRVLEKNGKRIRAGWRKFRIDSGDLIVCSNRLL